MSGAPREKQQQPHENKTWNTTRLWYHAEDKQLKWFDRGEKKRRRELEMYASIDRHCVTSMATVTPNIKSNDNMRREKRKGGKYSPDEVYNLKVRE